MCVADWYCFVFPRFGLPLSYTTHTTRTTLHPTLHTQQQQMLELVADYARIKYGPASYELTDPATPAAARYAALQRFNNAAATTTAAGGAGGEGGGQQVCCEPFLYLITPRSIGLGTQLPGLSAAIIFESDWHPRLDIQALHR